MRRILISLSLVALMAATVASCRKTECELCPGYCNDSGCYACTSDDHCWPIENTPCNGIETCALDEVCTEYGCARVCSLDTDCALGERCLVGGICGPADDVATPCEQDEDCGNGQICEDNICIDGCQSDDDCPGDEVCTACGRCAPPENPVCGDYKEWCLDSTECGTGRVCTELARCALECDTAEPLCPFGQVCVESVCVDDPDPQDPQCALTVDCANQDHCADNGCLCVNTYCQPLCELDTDCLFGQFCDLGLCKADYRPEE